MIKHSNCLNISFSVLCSSQKHFFFVLNFGSETSTQYPYSTHKILLFYGGVVSPSQTSVPLFFALILEVPDLGGKKKSSSHGAKRTS
jgi:hypothetical protein